MWRWGAGLEVCRRIICSMFERGVVRAKEHSGWRFLSLETKNRGFVCGIHLIGINCSEACTAIPKTNLQHILSFSSRKS